MSSYTKTTDFASKDGLLTGNPLKIVSGTELNDEFNALQVAVNTKANSNSPTLTGVPLVPTATAGTSTTQVASTAFATIADVAITVAYTAADDVLTADLAAAIISLTAALQLPVGSIYTNASVATNPATLLGYGTWVAFGAGRVQVGLDAAQTEFDTLGETGGAKTHTLLTSEIPAHTHGYTNNSGTYSGYLQVARPWGAPVSSTTGSTGGGGSHNNLQPYITVYAWKRTV